MHLKDTKTWLTKSVEELIANLDAVPENIRTAVRNNGGGHANHYIILGTSFHLTVAEIHLAHLLKQSMLNSEALMHSKKSSQKLAATRFGSGWAWLVSNNGELEITSTPNQDSPLMEGKTPFLV